MIFDKIEQLKRQYTDKYVVVDESRPELRRFGGMTGTVKTVNMSGRALVQFDADNNIGWYDIDLGYLKVVDRPPPKPEAQEAKKAAPKAERPTAPAANEKPVGEQPAVAAKAGGGKSVAEILAAARSGAKAAPTAEKESPQAEAKTASPAGDKPKLSPAEVLAAARAGTKAAPAAAPKTAPAAKTEPAAKADPKKLSVAEILAAARGKSPAAAPTPTKPAEPIQESAPPAEEPAAEEIAAEPAAVAPEPAAAGGAGAKSLAGKYKTPAEMVAFLRSGK